MRAFNTMLAAILVVHSSGNACGDILCQAIGQGDLQTVLEFDLSDPSRSAQSLLYALGQGQYDMAMLLLEQGARTNVEGSNGDTALVLAVKNHLLTRRMLEKIMAKGAFVEHVHVKTGMTAMMYAAKSGFIKGMQLLSDFGASFDRVNIHDGKDILDYAADDSTVAFLMKSHRFIAKSLARHGFQLQYDQFGFPQSLAMGASGILYWVKKDNKTALAKFCYDKPVFQAKGIIEYQRCREREERFAKEWKDWFNNKLNIQSFDTFFIKDYVKGNTLTQWMKGNDPSADFGSDDEKAQRARTKLKEFVVRMLKAGKGFIGDLNTGNLLFSESDDEWVVVDGAKTVACYSASDHEWIWLEYCQLELTSNKDNQLRAFRSYAIGPNPTGNHLDDENFGIWLKGRMKNNKMEEPSDRAKAKMVELISTIRVDSAHNF
jgi:hypothetical protein